jgi:hypothetical protein
MFLDVIRTEPNYTHSLKLSNVTKKTNLQIEIVVKMEIVEIFTVNQQIQHVVSLTQNLETSFNPVQRGGLEELRRFEGTEKISKSKNY